MIIEFFPYEDSPDEVLRDPAMRCVKSGIGGKRGQRKKKRKHTSSEVEGFFWAKKRFSFACPPKPWRRRGRFCGVSEANGVPRERSESRGCFCPAPELASLVRCGAGVLSQAAKKFTPNRANELSSGLGQPEKRIPHLRLRQRRSS